jgi:hypothetical protein
VTAINDKRLGNEKQSDRQEPENHVHRAGFDDGSQEIRDDHQKDRSKNEVGEAEFLEERRAVRLKGCFGSDS